MRKVIFWLPVALLLIAVAVLLALAWVVSNRFLVPRPYSLMAEFEILSVAPDGEGEFLVTMPRVQEPDQFADVAKEGVYNLLWEGGWGRLGETVAESATSLTRRVGGVIGRPPEADTPARLDVTVFRRDPLADHGIAFEELELTGEAGRLYAWWIERPGERAVLALHGRRRADRTETLRMTPVLADEGWSVLALAYRNHDRSDMSPDGFFHYGQSEAGDALVAVEELRSRGVREIALYGYSMGGAVAIETAKRWPQGESAPRLVGMVLDSPLLDPRTVIRHNAARNDPPLPGPIADLALWLGGLRAGIDWGQLDARRTAPHLDVPILLIAGTDDATIPVSLADEFASSVSAPIRYLRMEGVEHVEGWNRQRERYELAVREFLRQVGS